MNAVPPNLGEPALRAGSARTACGLHPATCRHCGSPLLTDAARAAGFCCAGCAYVHRLVHAGGFDQYYRLKEKVIAPVDSGLFQPRDFGWLAARQREAEAAVAPGSGRPDPRSTLNTAGAAPSAGPHPRSRLNNDEAGATPGPPELVLDLQGISCVGCVWLIEKLFEKEPGALRLELNAQLGRMRLRWEAGRFEAVHFARTLQSFGYLVGPPGAEPAGPPESRDLAKRIGLCAAFWMNVMLFTLPGYFGMTAAFTYARLFGTLALVFGTLSFLAGGTYFIERAARALRDGVMHIDLPIALGIVGAYAASVGGWIAGASEVVYFDFVASFVLLMLIGRWAQVVAVERNRRRLLRHRAVAPPLRIFGPAGAGLPAEGRPTEGEPGGRAEVAVEALQTGHVFELPMGHTLPVEARLLGGDAVFTTAWINGEAEPRLFRPGQHVPAGAVNVTRGNVRLEAVQSWGESLLTRLLQTEPRPGYRQRLLERVIRGYLIGILGLALTAGAGWALAAGDARRALAVAIAVLVVSCPCALGLALPLAEEMATAAARRAGVFVRENDLWARLGRVRKIIFDKTGTLTLEVPALANPGALAALGGADRAALLALVRDNPHPVSQRLHEELLITGDAPEPLPGTPREEVGLGVSLATPAGTWTLGRPGWRPGGSSGQCQPIVDIGAGAADTEFRRDGAVLARFHFAEAARADARIEVEALRAAGRDVYLLSGDRREKVEAIARQLGVPPERAVAGALPEEKAGWVRRLDRQDTLMLGDGANDSLAFEHAFCRGTPVVHRGVLEQKSDFYYLGGGVGGIRRLLGINRARARTQAWILAFAVAYNVVAVGFAAAGRINPLVAAVLMPASALVTLAITGLGMRGTMRG